ncbi:MAG: glycosyltransferase family 39 protein [Candidatus Woesearchaeota archaeon]
MVKIKKVTLLLFVILTIFFFRGLYLNSFYSITSDEPVIYTGLALWKTTDFAHSPSHPPGMKLLVAWATMLLGPDVPIPQNFPNIDEFLYGRLLIFQYNRHMFQQMICFGRFVALLLGIIGAVYVYKWAKEVANEKSALVAVVLYAFLPLMVGLSSIADNDIMISTFFIMTLYYFKHFVQSGETRDAVITGMCLGIALLSKHTGILLVPILGIAALSLIFTKQPVPVLKLLRRASEFTLKWKIFAIIVFFIFIGAISAFVLNAGYLFQGTFTPLREYNFEQRFITLNNQAIGWIPVPLPFWYLKGLETNQIFSKDTHYFHGRWLTSEDWYFFIFSFIVKTPFALLLMLVIGLILLPKIKYERTIDLILILLTVGGVTLLFSIKQYKLGIRHLLPIYPLIFVFIAIVWKYASEHKMLKRVFSVLLAWYLISSVLVHPYYLSYFNEIIGGSQNGYKYFLDSNVDWGQDLNAVKKWMDKNNISEIGLSYFGNDVPEIRGIKYHTIPCEPSPGIHVLSINNLYGLLFTGQPKDCYAWLRNMTPTDRIGYSILVFNIRNETKNN